MKAVLHSPPGSTNLETSHFTFGSSPDNSLVIDNIKVSAHHAEIRSEDNGSSITDLGSIHGTYVNGERLDFNSPRLLSPGDSITIGDSIFTYDLEEPSQIEETIPISRKREEEHEVLSGEDLTTPLSQLMRIPQVIFLKINSSSNIIPNIYFHSIIYLQMNNNWTLHLLFLLILMGLFQDICLLNKCGAGTVVSS